MQKSGKSKIIDAVLNELKFLCKRSSELNNAPEGDINQISRSGEKVKERDFSCK